MDRKPRGALAGQNQGLFVAQSTNGTHPIDGALSQGKSPIKGERRIPIMDRVAVVALVWFVGWTTAACQLMKYLFHDPGTGAILGFTLALLAAA